MLSSSRCFTEKRQEVKQVLGEITVRLLVWVVSVVSTVPVGSSMDPLVHFRMYLMIPSLPVSGSSQVTMYPSSVRWTLTLRGEPIEEKVSLEPRISSGRWK